MLLLILFGDTRSATIYFKGRDQVIHMKFKICGVMTWMNKDYTIHHFVSVFETNSKELKEAYSVDINDALFTEMWSDAVYTMKHITERNDVENFLVFDYYITVEENESEHKQYCNYNFNCWDDCVEWDGNEIRFKPYE